MEKRCRYAVKAHTVTKTLLVTVDGNRAVKFNLLLLAESWLCEIIAIETIVKFANKLLKTYVGVLQQVINGTSGVAGMHCQL